MTPHSDNYSDLVAIIQAAINPMVAKMQILENKVDGLSQDRVTRTDLEKLRGEIVGSFVDRASYEARHASLVEHNAQLDSTIRELRKDTEADMQKIHERFESGKQQIEERIKANQEKPWMRLSQIAGFLGVALVILDWLSQHLKF